MLTDTQATSYEYAGEYGHSYTFRVRATDTAGNVGAWAEAEVSVAGVTKYYAFGGGRVAMRTPDGVFYLHTNHLGSTSLATTAAGAVHSRQGYYPYGETRYTAGELPTDFHFTGQRNESTIGLYDYHARWYDPYLARFISADTIIPNPAAPQAFNRYSYVLGNPLKYTDPSGHCIPGYNCPQDKLPPPPDGRDLTYWLVAEANADATSVEVMLLRAINESPSFGICRGLSWPIWISLVKDSARWDFKDEIYRKFGGDPIRLGDEWFEYSTAGNILYGFNGAAAGFTIVEQHLGASAAQIWDDLRSDNPKDDIGPILPSFLDQVDDYYAVDFGYQLYKKYGADVTEAEFRAFLVDYKYADRLAKVVPPTNFVPPPDDWPYDPGTFDNPEAIW